MRKELLSAISAFALMTGTAFAQDTSSPSETQPAPAMQDQQGSEMQSEGDANVTIIEPEEGEAETTVIEPEAEGEEAETTVIEPETEGEATETMAAGTASAEELMGMSVVGSDGEELGEISDVIIDPDSGEAQQVVISSGGFLGLGERTIAVDYQDLQVDPEAENVQAANLTQSMVEEMPEFEYTDDMASLGRQGEAVVTEPDAETAQ